MPRGRSCHEAPTQQGKPTQKWELLHLFKNWKLGNCVEGDQGKRKFVWPKTRTEYEALPRIGPCPEGAALSEPLRRPHGESFHGVLSRDVSTAVTGTASS